MQNALKLGSEAHQELLCRGFIVIHREFDPEKLPWPDLNGPALYRLCGLPVWEQAIATEIEDGVKISAYAAQVRDPQLREAITLQGSEDLRHAALRSTLLTRYDVRTSERPPNAAGHRSGTALCRFRLW